MLLLASLTARLYIPHGAHSHPHSPRSRLCEVLGKSILHFLTSQRWEPGEVLKFTPCVVFA